MALEEVGVKLVTEGESQFNSSMQKAQASAVAFGVGMVDVGKKVGKYLEEGISKFVDYAEQVRDLGRISGASAEKTSALIQVADDLKVGYDVLTQAAKTLAQDGIALTTEELAKASDEYLKFSDQNDRTEYAVKKFGKAGLEMTKILEMGGDALRQMAKEQEGNLILTQKQLDSARQFEKIQDKLNDTVDGMWVALGSHVLPALTDFIELMNKGIDVGLRLVNWNDDLNKILAIHEKEVRKATLSWEDYVVEMMRANLAAKGINISTEQTIALIKEKNGDLNVIAKSLNLAAEGDYAVAHAQDAVNTELEQFKAKKANEAIDRITLAQIASSGEMDRWVTNWKTSKEAVGLLTSEMGKFKDALKDVGTEQIYQLASEGMSIESKLKLRMSLGLMSQEAFNAQMKIAELTVKFKEGKISEDELTLALQNAAAGIAIQDVAASGMKPINNKLLINGKEFTDYAAYSAWLWASPNAANAMKDKTSTLTTNIVTNNITNGKAASSSGKGIIGDNPKDDGKVKPGASGWGDEGNGSARAMGGSVWKDHPYFVGERGPEMFVPKVSGSIISNRSIAAAVSQSIGGMYSGPSVSNTSNYNLSVMTNNNSAAVMQSFNLMKMLAG